MRTIRTLRRRQTTRVAAQAVFFLALLAAFLLGMVSTRPRLAMLQTSGQPQQTEPWSESAITSPLFVRPAGPGAAPAQTGVSMRGVMEALPIQ